MFDEPIAPAADHILAGLNEEQLTAVTEPSNLLCIRAGAGSGKTRVLTRRIAYRSAIEEIDPRRVLALTFTRKAAGELNHRLRQLGLRDAAAAGTFHAIALAQLRQRWEADGTAPPTLLDRKFGFVARLLPRASDRTTAMEAVAEIEWAKARRIGPDRYRSAALESARSPKIDLGVLASIYEAYEETKTKRNLLDFDDILIWCGRMLQRDTQAVAAFRWRFRHIFVDEFQDVNPLQFALLKVFVGDEPDLCVVGDSRQAIYAWNGADSSYLDRFEHHFPSAVGVSLRRNHRSTPEILKAANAVLSTQDALEPTRPSSKVPTISEHVDDTDEARSIARALRRTHSGARRWRDMAVLVRTNAQVTLMADELADLSVPVRSRTGANLVDRPEIRDAIDAIRPPDGSLHAALEELAERISRARDRGATDSTDETVDDLADGSDESIALQDAFLRLGRDHLALEPASSLDAFVQTLRTAGDDDGFNSDRVDVSTFHAAKGLEWDVVHIAGMEKGLAPIGHANTDEAIAEEYRLIYVAITRARDELTLHWANERRFGDRVSKRTPSPMLEDIAAAARGEDPHALRVRNRERAAAAKKNVQSRRGRPKAGRPQVAADDPALVALKRWRASVSKANGVPAYVVFHDSTLHAIADAKPTSHAGLSKLTGIGPVKVERYGDDLLRVLEDAD